jgi:hypothetical protein
MAHKTHCERYLNEKRRIRNRTHKLNIQIKSIKETAKEVVIKNSRIGRNREGFQVETFKQNRPKVKEVKLHPAQQKCFSLVKDEYIEKNGYRSYFCRKIKNYITIRHCKSCEGKGA